MTRPAGDRGGGREAIGIYPGGHGVHPRAICLSGVVVAGAADRVDEGLVLFSAFLLERPEGNQQAILRMLDPHPHRARTGGDLAPWLIELPVPREIGEAGGQQKQ